ncbi:MAG TPA: hypothetical protein VKR56_09575 [Candidatus Cybelea sp.]|nr:hypothetical protein [Candidatus Cybelea sp.]
MKSSSFFVFLAGAIVAVALSCGLPPGRIAAIAATPPPTPPPLGATAAMTPEPDSSTLPQPAATLFPLGAPAKSGKSTPTPSPPPNARKGLDGVWEVQIQHPDVTDYTHFQLRQQGGALSGTYLDSKKKQYPLVGTVDGQDVRLIVSLPNGTTLLLEGKLDGTTDMVGMLTTAGGQIPFTASYRAKEKWIENVNPSPGGISQPGSYTPP